MKYYYLFIIIFFYTCNSIAEEDDTLTLEIDELAKKITESVNNKQASTEEPIEDANKEEPSEKNTSNAEPPKPVIGYAPEAALKKYYNNKNSHVAIKEIENLLSQIKQYENNKQYEEAITLLYELIEIRPNTAYIHRLTRLLIDTERYKEAELEIKPLCHTLSPEWQSCFLLGNAQLMNKQLAKAADSYDRALLIDVEKAIVWLNRAIVEQERGHHNSAIQLLSMANNIEPNNINIILNIAISNEAIGNNHLAFQYYKKYLSISKNDQENRALRLSILSHLSKIQLATQ